MATGKGKAQAGAKARPGAKEDATGTGDGSPRSTRAAVKVKVKAAGAKAGKTAQRKRIPYTGDEVAEIFARLAAQRPSPKPELEHRDAFTLLVAVVLSAQATDAGVNRATRGLFARAGDAATMAALGEEAIRDEIKTIGLYRNKAKNVAALSAALLAEHGGEVPRTRKALEALPGVGRKTANVVLNTAFGEETLAVDTHIFRLGNRLKLAPGKTPDAVEQAFLKIIPEPYLRDAHHWLILHGRYVCKARRPLCDACILADLCRADEKWNAEPAPVVPIVQEAPGLAPPPEA